MITRKWSKQRILSEAYQYDDLNSFRKESYNAYHAAMRYKLLDEICENLQRRKHNFWTIEEIKIEASKYTTRTDFRLGSKRAYDAARDRQILDEACAHMVSPPNGFDRASEAIVYYLRVRHSAYGFLYKIGVTNFSVEERFRTDMRRLKILKTWHFKVGAEASKFERNVITTHKLYKYKGERFLTYGGESELFTKDILNLDHNQKIAA